MTYSSCDVHSDIDETLTGAGYELEEDEEKGWYWRPSGSQDASHIDFRDTEGEATAAAIGIIVRCAAELRSAAQMVVDRWERGDLAEAVRDLDSTLRATGNFASAAREQATALDSDGSDPAVILDGAGAPIGHLGWLLQGDAHDGPWQEGVFMEMGAALNAAVAVAQEWAAGGIEVNEQEVRAALIEHGHYQLHEDMTPSVTLTAIDVIG